ncbi:short-chain dehydrogenase/reductase [Streptomyces sulfonofaciens]|uniref:Short-chain dehydrogenase/reductase n=1 Tax=Streptomyces sulfonofaciens TaxID=68272 RepID=A0A919G9F9_9ACTN|nr:SDR family NAD(P)-dependent oxidoreductase [Streptomyces sulfonofaciens]GHH80552.1 short-chain dehydrogenase/reductase [Streptomyces sulfonofaciens]
MAPTTPATPDSLVWFVTGSSRGLGRAVVEAVLAAGHRVTATARTPARLDDLVERYGPDRIRAVPLDVADGAAARTAVAEAAEAFGRLDAVVNNAGYGDVAAIEDVSDEAFRAQIDTNFYGVYHVTKAALPILRAQGSGHVIQISSSGGRITTPGLGAYQSAKWAVGGFSEVLAKEVRPLGINVTIVEPGGLRTDWAGSSMRIPPVSEPYRQTVGVHADLVRGMDGRQNGDPHKAAEVILQLPGLAEPPLHLLLGSDAYRLVTEADRRRAAADETWRSLSESIDYESGAPVPQVH